MNKLFKPLIPFLLISALMLNTWFNLLFSEYYYITLANWLGLGFYFLTLFVYLKNFKYGTLMIGVILFISTFNVISFFLDTSQIALSASFSEHEVYTPGIQPISLLILILYIILNFSALKDFWEEMGPEKSVKK